MDSNRVVVSHSNAQALSRTYRLEHSVDPRGGVNKGTLVKCDDLLKELFGSFFLFVYRYYLSKMHHNSQGITGDVTDVLTHSGDYLETIYQLKWLPWRGEFSPIVTQNVNGACPLLALCNVLLLRGKMHIAPGTTAISSHELLNNLATIMFELMPQVLSILVTMKYSGICLGAIRGRVPELSAEYP